MTPSDGHTREQLRLFVGTWLETGNLEEAMWCVLAAERRHLFPEARAVQEATARALVAAVCEQTSVPLEVLRSRARPPEAVQARRIAARALRDAGYSLRGIARHIGCTKFATQRQLCAAASQPDLIAAADRARAAIKAP